jgi:hypothetical protein
MQVMPSFANDWCALAASGGCFENAIAAGVWQLRHSAESFAFSSFHIFCASSKRWAAQGKTTTANAELFGEISRFSISTVCDKRELFWPKRFFNFRVKEITRILGHYLAPRHAAGARPDERP